MNIREIESVVEEKIEEEQIEKTLQKTTLYVLITMEELIDQELVEGKKILTPKGLRQAKKLLKSGWLPSNDMMIAVLSAIGSGGLFDSPDEPRE